MAPPRRLGQDEGGLHPQGPVAGGRQLRQQGTVSRSRRPPYASRNCRGDDGTGVARLRLTPVNADVLYADYGGPATTSFHEARWPRFVGDVGTPGIVSCRGFQRSARNRKSGGVDQPRHAAIPRIHGGRRAHDGNPRRAHAVPIRYSTDGSDPKVAGGAYNGPFAVPPGARLILAVAEKDGIVSDLHRREIAEKPAVKPIDKTSPAHGPPTADSSSPPLARPYGFVTRLKRNMQERERPAPERPHPMEAGNGVN